MLFFSSLTHSLTDYHITAIETDFLSLSLSLCVTEKVAFRRDSSQGKQKLMILLLLLPRVDPKALLPFLLLHFTFLCFIFSLVPFILLSLVQFCQSSSASFFPQVHLWFAFRFFFSPFDPQISPILIFLLLFLLSHVDSQSERNLILILLLILEPFIFLCPICPEFVSCILLLLCCSYYYFIAASLKQACVCD